MLAYSKSMLSTTQASTSMEREITMRKLLPSFVKRNDVLIASVLGYGLGMVVTVLATKQWYKDKYEKLAESEVDSVIDAFRSRNDMLEEHIRRLEGETPEEDVSDVVADEQAVTKYRGIARGYTSSPKSEEDVFEDDDTPENQDEPEYEEEDPNTRVIVVDTPYGPVSDEPYLIRQSAFGEIGAYDKVTLRYFEEDDVMVDENETPLNSYEEYVGSEFADNFTSDGVLFVRNTSRNTDYEIIQDAGSFQDFILGEHASRDKVLRMRERDDWD